MRFTSSPSGNFLRVSMRRPLRLALISGAAAFIASCDKSVGPFEVLPPLEPSSMELTAGQWRMILLTGPTQIAVAAPAAVPSPAYIAELDAIKVSQKNAGKLELPNWDETSRKAIHDALLVLAKYSSGFSHAFGPKGQVDPIRRLLGTAAGWGGNPRTAALYAGADPKLNDGKTAYTLTLKDVPVDGFWSVSVYNKAGFFEAKPISIPYAISVFPDELYQAPRSWAERAYPGNLIHFNELDRGGHFAAWEQPQLFAEEVRAGFSSLR